jgi:hypothetical protein
MLNEGNQIHKFYTVSVRTFVNPFYYGSSSGFALAKSYVRFRFRNIGISPAFRRLYEVAYQPSCDELGEIENFSYSLQRSGLVHVAVACLTRRCCAASTIADALGNWCAHS